MLAIYPFELSFVYPDAWYRLSLFLVGHLLYTSVSLVSFPFEYIIHVLTVMNNMSHALFGWSPLCRNQKNTVRKKTTGERKRQKSLHRALFMPKEGKETLEVNLKKDTVRPKPNP